MSVETIDFTNGNTLKVIDEQYVIGAGGACQKSSCLKGKVLNGEYWVDMVGEECSKTEKKLAGVIHTCEDNIYYPHIIIHQVYDDLSKEIIGVNKKHWGTTKKWEFENGLVLKYANIDFIKSGCPSQYSFFITDKLVAKLNELRKCLNVSGRWNEETFYLKYKTKDGIRYMVPLFKLTGEANNYVYILKEV
jgi:hypothetical protein